MTMCQTFSKIALFDSLKHRRPFGSARACWGSYSVQELRHVWEGRKGKVKGWVKGVNRETGGRSGEVEESMDEKGELGRRKKRVGSFQTRWRFLSIFCVLHFQRVACSRFQTCILNSH